ncbi:epoxide hydrolase, soluble (sEH) [Thoreauomyces humboldtii]|nr:epoxide hydrolase, soluble (sEH) [Thoreauomyces humboldtii]
MNEVTQFAAGHDDLIHDVAYDFYGRRLVTCSSDQKLKVWDAGNEGGAWVLSDSWKRAPEIQAHDSAAVRARWAHPEFGPLIASAGFDRTVRLWEEMEDTGNAGRRWVERARLADSRGAVQDLEFAPSHLGLKLAAVASDGIVRIYEALDVVQLGAWTLMDDIEVAAPGGDAHYCVSWCPSRFQPAMLAVGCGKENTVKIFRQDAHNKWSPFEILPGHTDAVTDVAWAPAVGRSYQLVATSSRDGRVRIFRLTNADDSARSPAWHAGAPTPPTSTVAGRAVRRYRVELVGDFSDHGTEVWRVEWNVTGTILSSSGDDGKVRLWKASYMDEWRCMSIISAEQNSGMDHSESVMR